MSNSILSEDDPAIAYSAKPAMSGKWFNPVQYDPNKAGYIDHNGVRRIAEAANPKLIIAGASAYSRVIGFVRLTAPFTRNRSLK